MSSSRLMFMLQPDAGVRAALEQLLVDTGLDVQLGESLFAPANWHQSLSERIYDPTPAQVDGLLAVGAAVQATGSSLCLDRIDSALDDKGRIQVTLRGPGHNKASLLPVLTALRGQLHSAGFAAIATGVTAHLTLSYHAPRLLPRRRLPEPLWWSFNELRLVLGNGHPYRYDVLGRWPLQPDPAPPQIQSRLF